MAIKPFNINQYQTQASDIDRQRKMAELLRSQGSEPAQGSMSKGFSGGQAGNPGFIGSTVYNQPDQYVPPSALAHVGNLAKSAGSAYMGYKADEAQTGLNQQVGQAQQEWQSSMPQATPGSVLPQAVSKDEEGNAYPEIRGPALPVTLEQIYQHGAKGMVIPGNEEIAKLYTQGASKTIEREDAQKQARENLELQQQTIHQRDYQAALDRAAKIAQDEKESRRDADLRRELAGMKGSSGGAKASDYRQEVAEDGTISYFNPATGARVAGGTGKPTGAFTKNEIATRDAIERGETAISEAAHAKELLEQGSSSGLRADVRRGAAYIFPDWAGGQALNADESLKILADKYLKSIPRFEGAQSNYDVQSYKEAAGQLANTRLPPATRAAALDEVVRLTRKSLTQMKARSTFTGDTNARKNELNPSGVQPGAPAALGIPPDRQRELEQKYGPRR